MPFTAKHRVNEKADALIDGILQAYRNDEVKLVQARHLLGHLINSAANGDEMLMREWLEPRRLEQWKKSCKDANRT